MLKQRVLTAAIALALVTGGMFSLPNAWWGFALAAPTLAAGHEWARLARFDLKGEFGFLLALLVGGATLGLLPTGILPWPVKLPAGAASAVCGINVAFWCVVAPCWLWLQFSARRPVALAIAGIVVLLPAWFACTRLQNNAILLLQLLAVIWIADCAAYFVGRALGGRKLAPAISPGKTWAGVGGAFGAVTVYAFGLHISLAAARDLPFVPAAFFAMTTFSIVGDLFESWLKRVAGVKDSGGLLPGHGGILDRVDGIVAALPLAALIFA